MSLLSKLSSIQSDGSTVVARGSHGSMPTKLEGGEQRRHTCVFAGVDNSISPKVKIYYQVPREDTEVLWGVHD